MKTKIIYLEATLIALNNAGHDINNLITKGTVKGITSANDRAINYLVIRLDGAAS